MATNSPHKRCVWGPGSTLPRERTAIDGFVGRPSRPENVLACTQNPSFEAFLGLQKHLKSRSGLKRAQNDRESPQICRLMELMELMPVLGGRQDFFVSGCLVAVRRAATVTDS